MEKNDYQTLYPSAKQSFSNGWSVLKDDFWKLLVVVLISMIVGGLGSTPSYLSMLNGGTPSGFFSGIFPLVWSFFVGIPVGLGAYYIFILSVRNKEWDLGELFAGYKVLWNGIGTSILVGLIIGAGFLALIIPGFIFLCRLSFAPYLVIDKKLSVLDAISESWRMTKGHGWNVLGLFLLSILVAIGGLILLGIGIFPAIVWIYAATASMYQSILNANEQKTAEPEV